MKLCLSPVLVTAALLCGGCPEKEKAAKAKAEAAGGSASDHAPVVQPVENKLDKAMQKNEDRSAPDVPGE